MSAFNDLYAALLERVRCPHGATTPVYCRTCIVECTAKLKRMFVPAESGK